VSVRVTKNSEKPESQEILAEAIIRIGDGFKALREGGLNERAIIALIHDHTSIAKRTIAMVLASLRTLKGYYCR